uniref:Titin n=1 Tax=Hucho hucho TaxID=62062 RepID=A0A4W5MT91_9TELE
MPANFAIKEITKNSVTLTWEPPILDGGSKIKQYHVEKRESTRKVYSPVTTCHKMSWKIEPLVEGSIYFFRVLAENEWGIGLPAETPEPLKISEVPQPPGKVTVLDVTRNSVSLKWEKPDHDGGSRISHYEIEMQSKDSDKWTLCAQCKYLETTVTSLAQGEEYQFRVIAVNSKGKSDSRLLANPVVVKDLVIEPDIRPKLTQYSVQVGYDLKIEVPIAGHPKPVITWTKDGAALKQTTRINVVDSARNTHLTIKEATKYDGGLYSINITNMHGSKDATIEVITLDKPGPPTGPIKMDDISAESVTLTWEPPSYTGGCPISNYVVQKRDTTTTNWVVVSATVARNTLKVTNLKTGAEYQFRICAENRYGKSYAIDSEPVLAQYPFKDAIFGYHIERKEKNTDGGSSISHYVIQKRETSRLAWTVVASDCGATMFKVTKLLMGNEYIFRVMAVNKFGTGEPLESAPVIMRNQFVTPGPPQELEIANIARDSMTVCWTRPEVDGGSDIAGYIVEKRDRAGIRWTKCNKRRVTDLRFRVTGLTEDHEYEFRLSAENAAGVGQPTEPTPYTKACDPTFEPGPPTNAHVVDTSKNSITLAWSRPIYDGGVDIQGYAVEICKADEDEWTLCTPPTGVNATSFKITKLTEHQEYKVQVCAINKLGIGEPAEILGTVKPVDSAFVSVKVLDTPGAPVNFTVKDIKKNSVNLVWEPPLIDGGARVKHYFVEKRESTRKAYSNISNKCTRNSFHVGDLNEGVIYYFRVMAENEYGVGLAAETAEPVKTSEVPLPVGKVTLTEVTKTTASMAWEKPDHD